MKIKRKPTAPTRKMYDKYISVSYGDSLATILEQLPKDVDPSMVEVKTGWEEETKLCYKELESDEDFNERQTAYQNKLEDWKDWYEENKDSYELHLAEKDKKRKKELEYQKNNIAKQIEGLQKKLKKL